MTSDLPVIKQGLIDRIEEVCRRLLPDGRMEGGQWVSFNPITGDYRPGRLPALKIRIHGGVAGAWKDWRDGEKGDALALVAYVLTGDTRATKQALAWGRDFLGLAQMTRADRLALAEQGRKHKQAQDERAARSRAYKLKSAEQLFSVHGETSRDIGPAGCPHGTFPFCGAAGHVSPAERHAQAYFAARQVPIADAPADVAAALARTMRFSPATEYWRGATWKTEGLRKIKAEAGPLYPAVHSAMRNATGIVTACHVTFLDPAAPAKAPVAPAKLMWGEARGAVIELSTGPAGEPFWLAREPAPLIIAEGIETALSFAVNQEEARVWAGGSLAGICQAPVGLDCVSWILFARDNNVGNPQAQQQFEAALAELESHGKRVVVKASHVGDDFNDLAKGDD
ncbi:toprim domain-containing protein [Mesorhizobium sp. Z1-4]|uniref:DUF7146 domain-containing protein n=1 Tax=Mesorhizobium sp. Z1-4 TaxID=2448478 RepID=UPI000FDA4175|nr:toprim domain-containing protein [Mesorhizobium sp. Z1-4]